MTQYLSAAALGRLRELESLRTLPELLGHHLTERPDLPLYQQWDQAQQSWRVYDAAETARLVGRWRAALARAGLERGDRVAMLLPNCLNAVLFDQAALANALVPVPLHAIDNAGSSAFILGDSQARLLVTNRLMRWDEIRRVGALPDLRQVVVCEEDFAPRRDGEVAITPLARWLAEGAVAELPRGPEEDDLAALVYTSGTTGRPKGVMLTHRAILCNVRAVLRSVSPEPDDVWFSFLPLSHTLERTTTYYTALGFGNLVGFNRSLALLQEDIRQVRPSVLVSVPRVYEMIYEKLAEKLRRSPALTRLVFDWAVEVGWRRFLRRNGLPPEPGRFPAWLDPLLAGPLDRKVGAQLRAFFGGRPKFYISGGAAINPRVSRVFIGLGVEILQGYGMTETSPIIAVNQPDRNRPDTVGPALSGLEVRIGDNEELQVRGPSLMRGYWRRPEDSAAAFCPDGWLRTGDQAEILPEGHLRIKGRIKEIIVTSTGEKVPPADLERALEEDPLIAQAMVLGERRPYLIALLVLSPRPWAELCRELGLDPDDPASLTARPARTAVIRRVRRAAASFPNYAVPRAVRLYLEPWTIDNGLLTPTMKIRRGPLRERFAADIEAVYGELRA